MNEEEALIRSFVVKQKRDRLIEFLSSQKQRRKATATLAHFRDLDQRFVVRLRSNEQSPESIARALRQRGATDTCHVISESAELDGKRLSLEVALEQVVGQGLGTLLSCVPGALGYFEGEGPGDRCILSRRAACVVLRKTQEAGELVPTSQKRARFCPSPATLDPSVKKR